MQGFFDDDFITIISTEHYCLNCNLNKKCKHPNIKPVGNGNKKILIITDSPNKAEDSVGKLLCDNAGIWFKDQLKKRKLDFDDFWITSATQCHSEDPTRNELSCCFPNITKFIKDNDVKFVWLLGENAIEQWFMSRFSDLSELRWRGLCIPDIERKVWVMPLYHPYHVTDDEKNILVSSQYIRDLEFAIKCTEDKPKLKDLIKPDIKNVTIMKDFEQVCYTLTDLIERPPEYLIFDYETTGLKPYREGHKIASISFCYDFEMSYSFPYQYPHWKPFEQKCIKELWIKLLKSSAKKVAHNIKFEDVWSRIILKTLVMNWSEDTMIRAHSIDNRPKYSGLKFQAFLHWGIPNYSKEIKPYLENANDKGFNQIMKVPLNKLLLYGGIDSLLEYWLLHQQSSFIDSHLEKGIDLFTEGTLALADVQIHGINMDADYYSKTHSDLVDRIKKLDSELLNYEECQKFKEVYGTLPNLGSSKDLGTMFFKVMKLEPIKKTDSGLNYSVDADTMSKLNSPLAKAITELSRLKKVDGTYIMQFIRETDDDGRIHPFYDITNVRTYRGCIAKGTLIHVVRDFIKHPNGIPIEAIQKGDYVYCFDNNLKPAIRKVLWAGKTGFKKIIRLHWKTRSSKGYLDVTPEHKIRLITGEYVEAKEFAKKDFIVKNKKPHDAFKRTLAIHRSNDQLYFSLNTSKNGHGIYEHRLIYKELIDETLQDSELVHHKNEKHLDHTPSNLEKMDNVKHGSLHNRSNAFSIRCVRD